MKRTENISKWAKDREIFKKSTALKQITKTQEELTETRDAIVAYRSRSQGGRQKDYYDMLDEVKDGIGDMAITLEILSQMFDWTLEECVEHAWQEIKGRKGKMIDGIFVKEKVPSE